MPSRPPFRHPTKVLLVDDEALVDSAVRAALADLPEQVVAVEVNLSCPNLHHGSDLFAHDPEAVGDVVALAGPLDTRVEGIGRVRVAVLDVGG